MDQSQQILAELRDMRKEHQEFARTTGERLASLETSMKNLVGPDGRIAKVEGKQEQQEERIDGHDRWKYYVVGFSVAIGAVVGWCSRLVPALLR